MLGYKLQTARLVLSPVNWSDMDNMARLKADVLAFGRMLGGVRSRVQAEEDMAEDVALWARRGVGIFSIYENSRFIGMTGVHERPDGRGLGLRISILPGATGRGFAREAAARALSFVLDHGEECVVAVAREDNTASRVILGAIGMTKVEQFERGGHIMFLYEKRHQRFQW